MTITMMLDVDSMIRIMMDRTDKESASLLKYFYDDKFKIVET